MSESSCYKKTTFILKLHFCRKSVCRNILSTLKGFCSNYVFMNRCWNCHFGSQSIGNLILHLIFLGYFVNVLDQREVINRNLWPIYIYFMLTNEILFYFMLNQWDTVFNQWNICISHLSQCGVKSTGLLLWKKTKQEGSLWIMIFLWCPSPPCDWYDMQIFHY